MTDLANKEKELMLTISNIRCHSNLSVVFKPGINILYGANGSGKTSIMEALTLISPAKSIRSAKLEDIASFGSDFFEILISHQLDDIKAQYFKAEKANKLNIFFNGKPITKIGTIKHISFLWLTQRLMFNFWQDATSRRTFIDRICANIFIDHTENLVRYEKIRMQRKNVIEEGSYSKSALQTYNEMLIIHGLKVFENRRLFAEKINTNLEPLELKLVVKDEMPKIDTLDSIFVHGPHNAKISIQGNSLDYMHGSTGEQNAVLIYFILEAAKIIDSKNKVLLLDDIFSGIDSDSRAKIIATLINYNMDWVIISMQEFLTYFTEVNWIKVSKSFTECNK